MVVAPHAIFVVEIKSYRARIEGTDNDWWLPEKIRSPIKLNRVTAQVLKTHLRNASYQAGQVWTEGLVFLSATTVRVIDLTKMVEGRLTLVMERVSGTTLRQWMAHHPTPEPTAQRRLAEDLIAGLAYSGAASGHAQGSQAR